MPLISHDSLPKPDDSWLFFTQISQSFFKEKELPEKQLYIFGIIIRKKWHFQLAKIWMSIVFECQQCIQQQHLIDTVVEKKRTNMKIVAKTWINESLGSNRCCCCTLTSPWEQWLDSLQLHKWTLWANLQFPKIKQLSNTKLTFKSIEGNFLETKNYLNFWSLWKQMEDDYSSNKQKLQSLIKAFEFVSTHLATAKGFVTECARQKSQRWEQLQRRTKSSCVA